MPKNLKDKRIKIYNYDSETDSYILVDEVWAHYRSMSIREVFNCGADQAFNNAYFTFTKPNFTLDTYSEIEYNGKRYSVEGIDLFDDKDGNNIRVHGKTRY